MMVRVERRLTDNLTIVNARPALAAGRLALQARIAGIRTTDVVVTANVTGVTGDKKVLRTSLNDACELMGATLASYAGVTGNNTLYAEVYKSRTEIDGIRDDQIGTYAQLLFDRATSNLANLGDYGVTAASIAAFGTLKDTYNSDSQKPKIAVDSRKAAGASLKLQMKDSMVWMKKVLDKLVLPLRTSAPDFVAAYLNDRVIVDDGRRRETPPPTPPA